MFVYFQCIHVYWLSQIKCSFFVVVKHVLEIIDNVWQVK